MTYTGKNGTYVIQCKMLIRSEFDMVVYKDQISLQDEAILKELLSPEEKKMVVRAVARHFKLAKVKVLFK